MSDKEFEMTIRVDDFQDGSGHQYTVQYEEDCNGEGEGFRLYQFDDNYITIPFSKHNSIIQAVNLIQETLVKAKP